MMANMMRMAGRLVVLLLALLLLPCGAMADERPAEWAQPVDISGVPNLYRVAAGLYRSAQPTAAGMAELDIRGVRTLINLSPYRADGKLIEGTRLREVRIPVNLREIRDAQVIAVLRHLKRAKDGPFLIHCENGAERTGLMVAMYRIVVEGWRKERAIAEMALGGYGQRVVWRNIVRYIGNVDVEKIRREVDA